MLEMGDAADCGQGNAVMSAPLTGEGNDKSGNSRECRKLSENVSWCTWFDQKGKEWTGPLTGSPVAPAFGNFSPDKRRRCWCHGAYTKTSYSWKLIFSREGRQKKAVKMGMGGGKRKCRSSECWLLIIPVPSQPLQILGHMPTCPPVSQMVGTSGCLSRCFDEEFDVQSGEQTSWNPPSLAVWSWTNYFYFRLHWLTRLCSVGSPVAPLCPLHLRLTLRVRASPSGA